jgi:hypothetical protein
MGRGIASFLGNEAGEGTMRDDFWDRFMERTNQRIESP